MSYRAFQGLEFEGSFTLLLCRFYRWSLDLCTLVDILLFFVLVLLWFCKSTSQQHHCPRVGTEQLSLTLFCLFFKCQQALTVTTHLGAPDTPRVIGRDKLVIL